MHTSQVRKSHLFLNIHTELVYIHIYTAYITYIFTINTSNEYYRLYKNKDIY